MFHHHHHQKEGESGYGQQPAYGEAGGGYEQQPLGGYEQPISGYEQSIGGYEGYVQPGYDQPAAAGGYRQAASGPGDAAGGYGDAASGPGRAAGGYGDTAGGYGGAAGGYVGGYDYDQKENKSHEHMGELGSLGGGLYSMYEKHEAKMDPKDACRHNIEADVGAALATGSAGYGIHEHHQKKQDEAKYERMEQGKKHGWF